MLAAKYYARSFNGWLNFEDTGQVGSKCLGLVKKQWQCLMG